MPKSCNNAAKFYANIQNASIGTVAKMICKF